MPTTPAIVSATEYDAPPMPRRTPIMPLKAAAAIRRHTLPRLPMIAMLILPVCRYLPIDIFYATIRHVLIRLPDAAIQIADVGYDTAIERRRCCRASAAAIAPATYLPTLRYTWRHAAAELYSAAARHYASDDTRLMIFSTLKSFRSPAYAIRAELLPPADYYFQPPAYTC